MFTRCHEPKNLDHQLVDVGGISGIKLDLYTNSTTLVRRNDIAAEFNVSGISVLYTPQMYEAAVAGTADLVLLGTDNKDKSIPLTMLEVNYNGTWIINPLNVKNPAIQTARYIRLEKLNDNRVSILHQRDL